MVIRSQAARAGGRGDLHRDRLYLGAADVPGRPRGKDHVPGNPRRGGPGELRPRQGDGEGLLFLLALVKNRI